MPRLLQAAVRFCAPVLMAACLAAVFLCTAQGQAAKTEAKPAKSLHEYAGPRGKSRQGHAPRRDKSLHGQAWAFGQSAGRGDDLWRKGLDGAVVSRRAAPVKKHKTSVDTSGGINRALKTAKNKSEVGVSMKDLSSAWKVDPNAMRADEFKPRDRRHVVRAYAGIKAGNDLDINFGPELSLRDERAGEETAHEKQPNSSLGVGMRFHYDF